jgi:ABC-type transport system involved in multi-copper enzyme maturation permease subunit
VTGLGWALRAEWLRLLGPRVLLLAPLAALLAAGYAWVLGATVEAGVLGAPSGFYLAGAASSAAAMTCAVVGALAASSGVGGDFSSGLVRTVLTRPVSRTVWIVARLLALGAGMSCVFLSACAGALLAGLLRFGASGSSEGDYVIASAGFLGAQLGAAVALSLLAQLTAVALGGAIGAIVRRPGSAVVVTVLGAAVLLTLGRWRPLEPLLPLWPLTTGLDRVAQLAQGIAGHHVGQGAVTAAIACALWLLAACFVAAKVIERGDIVT